MIPQQARQVQSVAEAVLGDTIYAIYLFGSAATGSLRKDSDVDVLVVVHQALSFEQRKALTERLLAISGAVGNTQGLRPIELTVIRLGDVLPWRYPPRAQYVYGEWLRDEFAAGLIPDAATDPDLTIVLKTLIDNSLPLRGEPAAVLLEAVPAGDVQRAVQESLPRLLETIQGDERNVLLTLCRMWFTSVHGVITSKAAAAQWAEARLPQQQAALVRYARLAYLGEVRDDWAKRQEELSKLVCLMQKAIQARSGNAQGGTDAQGFQFQ